ncbi:transglycosylase SLT domain-containing protein [Burkholderiaceae bacterium UC74_6]
MTLLHRLTPLAFSLSLACLLAACTGLPQQNAAAQTTASAPAPAAAPLAPAPAIAPLSAASAPLLAEPETAAVEIEDGMTGAKVQLDDAAAKADLWMRVRAGFTMPVLDNSEVARAEAWYSARPDYVQRMTSRGSRYLYHVVQECEKRGLPTELALLPFVESAFVTTAQSNAKASGLWQFMPATGRDFDLKQNIFRDDRRDVLASTNAALDYLTRLYKQFGDWHLALAAYNWGQGNVAKAIARNERAGLPTDFESLKLPDETRYYVPKLQAVKNIVMAPGNYGLSLPGIENHPYFLTVRIERDIDVALAARLAEMSEDEFRQFNPQMNKPVILANGTDQLLLPYDNVSRFASNLEAHRGPLATWTAWVVPKTMKPADAAKQAGMSEAQLRDVNRIPPKMLVKAGSTLLVPRTAKRDMDVSERLADSAALNLAPDVPPLRKVSFKAGKGGESVASVARRYRVGTSQVAQWNKVGAKSSFKTGQMVVIYTTRPEPALAAPATTTTKVAAKKPAASKPSVKTAAKPTERKARGGQVIAAKAGSGKTALQR